MSFLARFHWWRVLRGGRWEADSITGADWVRVDERANFVLNEIHEMGLRAIMSEEIKDLRRQLTEARQDRARAENSEKDFYRQIQLLTAQLETANKQYVELYHQFEEQELLRKKSSTKLRKKKPRDGIATPRK